MRIGDTVARTEQGEANLAQAKADYGKRRTEAQQRRRDVVGRLERLLAEEDIDLDEVGSIEKLRVNEWEVVTKGADGKPTKTKARAASIVINPKWETGPAWPLVEPPKPVAVNLPARPRPLLLKGYRTAIVEPDPQIGFIRAVDGTLHPIHDPRAIDVSEQIAEVERPHDWVNLGDYFDLAEFSTFRQEPGFVGTAQPALDYGHRHAAVMRACTSGRCWIHEGNHDQRLVNYFLDNARAAFGLKRANTPPGWPVLSVPYLLDLDGLGIEYADGYPATWRYINERLATTHGTDVGPDALKKIAEREQVSVISGHTHHAGTYFKTRNTRTAFVETFAHSAGTLARIDGFVPGGGKYRGRKVDGMPTRSWQDWQQGITVVRYVPGDGPVEIEHVVIREGVATHRGEIFKSKVKLP